MCLQARPGFWDLIGRAKHDAWASLGSMGQLEAMQVKYNYIYIKIISEEDHIFICIFFAGLCQPFVSDRGDHELHPRCGEIYGGKP